MGISDSNRQPGSAASDVVNTSDAGQNAGSSESPSQDERDREQRREHETNEELANDALEDADLLPLPEATPTEDPAPAP